MTYGQYEIAAFIYFTSTVITFLHILWVLFFINVYMVLFLFDNVIYVFLLLCLCILIVCLCMTTLTEVFPCFFLSCKANARVKLAKTGHCPHSPTLVICVVRLLFVLFYVLFVCKCVLPPGDNPIAVNKYIIIIYHTHLHSETTLLSSTSARSQRTFKQRSVVPDIREALGGGV